MKKLMIAAAIVCAAAFANAANYSWNSTGTIYTWDSTEAAEWPVVGSGTAYFIVGSTYTIADLVADFNNGTVNTTKLSASGGDQTINSDSTISAHNASSTYTSNQDAFFVVFDDAHMFISGKVTAVYDSLGNYQPVLFTSAQVDDVWNEATFNAADGDQGAGWYGVTAPTPEPTSGLLLLIGMAGLALRRRRA